MKKITLLAVLLNLTLLCIADEYYPQTLYGNAVLDSVIVQTENRKDVHYYDSKGNNTTIIRYEWSSVAKQWEKASKKENTYDSNGNKVLVIDIEWNKGNNAWETNPTIKREYTYDAYGNITLCEENEEWDAENNAWAYAYKYKYEYTYDNKGNITLKIDYYWNNEANIWVNSRWYEYTYDSNGNKSTGVSLFWDSENNIWVGFSMYYIFESNPLGKWEYQYDTMGNLVLVYSYSWILDTNSWSNAPTTKSEYTYDANGRVLLINSYPWDSEANEWSETASSKDEYTYNEHNDLISEIHLSRNDYMGGYYTRSYYNSEYYYDNDGNKTLKIENENGDERRIEWFYHTDSQSAVETIYQSTTGNQPNKILRSGTLLILLPDGRTYNLQGAEIK